MAEVEIYTKTDLRLLRRAKRLLDMKKVAVSRNIRSISAARRRPRWSSAPAAG